MSKALLNELFDEWLDYYDRGELWSPEELCDDYPELIEPLRARIEFWLDMHAPKRISLPPPRERRHRQGDDWRYPDEEDPRRGSRDRRRRPPARYPEDDDYSPPPRDAIAEAPRPPRPLRRYDEDDLVPPPIAKKPLKKSSNALVVVLVLVGVVVVISAIIVAWLVFSGAGYGKKVDVGLWEVYYKDGADQGEARRLGEYLRRNVAQGTNRRTVQLVKIDNTYRVRIVISAQGVHDPKIQQSWRATGADVKSQVFQNQPLEVHLCDRNLETKKVLNPYLTETLKNVTIFYDLPIEKEQARKVGNFLIETYGYGDKQERSDMIVQKAGARNKVTLVVAKKFQVTPKLERTYRGVATTLSQKIFAREPVVVELIHRDYTRAGSFTSR